MRVIRVEGIPAQRTGCRCREALDKDAKLQSREHKAKECGFSSMGTVTLEHF